MDKAIKIMQAYYRHNLKMAAEAKDEKAREYYRGRAIAFKESIAIVRQQMDTLSNEILPEFNGELER